MEKLKKQTVSPDKIIIMNTEERLWDDTMIQGVSQAKVYHISKKEFDHGRTRARGAEKTDSEFLIYFTGRRVYCGKSPSPFPGSRDRGSIWKTAAGPKLQADRKLYQIL